MHGNRPEGDVCETMKKTHRLLDQKIVDKPGLTFDDILLLPGYADFKRQETDLSVTLHPHIRLKLPVISSPMDTVTETAMAVAMARAGGLGIIHRNLSIARQAGMVAEVVGRGLLAGAAVGAGADFSDRLVALVKAGVSLVVIDSGHGYTKFVLDALKFIKRKYRKLPVMAGNVATYDGAKALIHAGADMLRCGMGPGSICTTRVVTGMGVPQISAIAEVVQAVADLTAKHVTIIADGGIRQAGDMAKALAFGARAVMLGSLLARFDESAGETVVRGGRKWKTYRGMGSVAAMKKGGAERYGQKRETVQDKLIAEGVEGLIPHAGPVADFLFQLDGSLRSSLYYIGARNIREFYAKSRAIVVTQASLIESHPHSIVVQKTGKNYLK